MRTERVLAGTIVHQEGREYDRKCFTFKLVISRSDNKGPADGLGPPHRQSCAASLSSEVAEGVVERVETDASLSSEVAERVVERVGWIDLL